MPKHGNPPDHDLAEQIVSNYVEEKYSHLRLVCWTELDIKFHHQFCERNHLRKDYRHVYDIVVSRDGHMVGFIEIDGERHSKKQQKINDGIAFKYLRCQYPECWQLRLDKREVLGEKEDVLYYLKKEMDAMIPL